MRRTVFAPIILLLALLLFAAGTQEAAARSILQEISERGTIRVGINAGVRPFTFVGDDGEYTGLTVDLSRLMAERMGVKVEFVDMDWNGLIPALLTRRIDVIGDRMSNTLERAMSISFTDPYFLTGSSMYTTADAPFSHWSEANKAGVRVGTVLGAIGEVLAETHLPNAQNTAYNTTADLTQALLAGRVDVAIEDEMIAIMEVQKAPDRLRMVPGYIVADTYSFGVRYENPELLHWLNLFFETIKRSGEFAEIYERWIGVPWQPVAQKQL